MAFTSAAGLSSMIVSSLLLSSIYGFSIRYKPQSKSLSTLERQKRHADDRQFLASHSGYLPYARYGDVIFPYNDETGRMEEFLDRYPGMSLGEEKFADAFDNNNEVSSEDIENLFELENEKSSKEKDEKITKTKMSELLSEVEEEQNEKENKIDEVQDKISAAETIENAEKIKPVSKEMLDEIFSDDQTVDDKDSAKEIVKTDVEKLEDKVKTKVKVQKTETEKEVSGESVPVSVLFAENKDKRVAKRDKRGSVNLQSVEDLYGEVQRLKEEIAKRDFVELLEEQENDYLALALKDATLAQLKGRDSFLQDEYKDIQNAIGVEEMLGELKDENDVRDELQFAEKVAQLSPDEEAVEALESDFLPEEYEVKRSGPRGADRETFDDNEGRWYDQPVSEERPPERLIIGEDDMTKEEADNLIHNFVQNYQNSKEPSFGSEPEDIPSSLQEIAGPLQNECGYISKLASNCQVAEDLGLQIDEDARDLCDRHELCYACGQSLGITKETCDGGFRSEVINICGAKSTCLRDGARFLWYIQSEHKYNYKYAGQCADTCIRDFIVGNL